MRRKVWRFGIHRRSIADMLMLVRSVVSRLVCRFCGRAVLELEKLILRHQLHLATSSREAAKHGLAVELKQASSSSLPLPGESVDMVFCHQTFHHLIYQHDALREFHRVLKPNGVLLFAESTRKYIHSWIIRMLFRHPMDAQRTAAEYLAMISEAGFEINPQSVSYPYLWWSRADLAIMERWFGIAPAADREETLINVVAVRN